MNRPGKLSSVTVWWETPNKLRWIGNHRSLRRVDLKISQGKSWGDERRIPKVCGFSKIFWKFSPRFLGVSWSNFHFDLRRIVQIGLKFKKPPPIAKGWEFWFLGRIWEMFAWSCLFRSLWNLKVKVATVTKRKIQKWSWKNAPFTMELTFVPYWTSSCLFYQRR